MNQQNRPADVLETPVSLSAPQMPPEPGKTAPAALPAAPGAVPPSPTAGTPSAPPRPPVEYHPSDALTALLCYLCGYLFLRMVRVFDLGLGVTLFTLCFCGLCLCCRVRRGGGTPRDSWPWLALTLAAALPFAVLTNGGVLPFFNLLFLMLCAVYWVSALFGTRLENRLGNYLTADLWNHFVVLPFGSFGLGFGALRWGMGKRGNARSALLVALTVLFTLPVLFYAAMELTAADATFYRMVDGLLSGVDWNLGDVFLRLLVAIPVACWFFGLLFGAAGRRAGDRLTAADADARGAKRRVIPELVPVTVLTLFCLLYLVFFGAQASTLLGALGGRRPDGVSYSQYARDGFFELCRVAVVNLLLLGCGRRYAQRREGKRSPLLRGLDILLCAETLLLIVTALSKMGLYIRFYGLTLLRVYTSWFMLLLFLVFAILILSALRPIRAPRWIAAVFCVLFLALCWCDVGGVIARHNIGRYRAGLDGELDPWALREVAVAAAPYVRDLYDSGDPGARDAAEMVLSWAWRDSGGYYDDARWLGGSAQKLRAREFARPVGENSGG